jgi:hypothetical protein
VSGRLSGPRAYVILGTMAIVLGIIVLLVGSSHA